MEPHKCKIYSLKTCKSFHTSTVALDRWWNSYHAEVKSSKELLTMHSAETTKPVIWPETPALTELQNTSISGPSLLGSVGRNLKLTGHHQS